MTISNNYAPDKSPGNGVTVLFTGTWSPLVASYMRVALQTVATGVVGAPLTQGSQYTLTFDEDGYEVDLTPLGAPSALFNVVRYREIEIDQVVPYKTSKGFQGKVEENSFDKGIGIDQDQQDQLDRSIKLQVASTAGPIVVNDPIAGRGLMVDPADPKRIIMSSANLEDLVAIAVAAAAAAAASAAAAAASAGAAATSATNASNSAVAAAASAALAQSWAIDPIGLRPQGSSKYWAEQAATIAGGLTVSWGGTSTNTGNQYTVTTTPSIVNAPGKVLAFLVNTPNTGGSTIVVNGAAAANIRKKIGGGYTNVRPNDLHTFAVLMGNGTEWILLNPAPTSNAADMASAATLDLTFPPTLGGGDYLNITGTTDITAITLLEGQERQLRFTGASLTITNGASLLLIGGVNYKVSAGDIVVVRGEASGVVRMTGYIPYTPGVGQNLLWNPGTEVNQRAAATYPVSTKTYGMDRWNAFRSTFNAGATLSPQAGFATGGLCARLQRDSGNTSLTVPFFAQDFPNEDAVGLAGKLVTLSGRYRTGANFSGASFSASIITGTGTNQTFSGGLTGQATPAQITPAPNASWTFFSLTGLLAANMTQVSVVFGYTPVGTAGAADYIEFDDLKLELGGVATPFVQPDRATEIDRCERFWEKSFAYATIPAVGLISSSTGAVRESTPNRTDRFGIGWSKPFRTRKRVSPTCVCYGNAATARVYDAGGGADRAVIVTGSETTMSVDGDVAVTTTANSTHAWQYTADAEL